MRKNSKVARIVPETILTAPIVCRNSSFPTVQLFGMEYVFQARPMNEAVCDFGEFRTEVCDFDINIPYHMSCTLTYYKSISS